MAELRKNSENQKENTFLFELVGREVLLYYKTCNLGFARCGQRGELSSYQDDKLDDGKALESLKAPDLCLR